MSPAVKLLALVAVAGVVGNAGASMVKKSCFFANDDCTTIDKTLCNEQRAQSVPAPTGYSVTGDCSDGCMTSTFAGSIPGCAAMTNTPGTTCNAAFGAYFTLSETYDCTKKTPATNDDGAIATMSGDGEPEEREPCLTTTGMDDDRQTDWFNEEKCDKIKRNKKIGKYAFYIGIGAFALCALVSLLQSRKQSGDQAAAFAAVAARGEGSNNESFVGGVAGYPHSPTQQGGYPTQATGYPTQYDNAVAGYP